MIRYLSFLWLFFILLCPGHGHTDDRSLQCKQDSYEYQNEYFDGIDRDKKRSQFGIWKQDEVSWWYKYKQYQAIPSCMRRDPLVIQNAASKSPLFKNAMDRLSEINKLNKSLGTVEASKHLLTDYPNCKTEVDNVYADVHNYFYPRKYDEANKAHSKIIKLIEFFNDPKQATNKCIVATRKAYILSSIAVFSSIPHLSISDLYLNLSLEGLNNDWLKPLTVPLRQELASSQKNEVWTDQLGSHFKMQGAYSCINSTAYIDIQLLPFNLAAVLIHELDHLIADKAGTSQGLPIPLSDFLAQEFQGKNIENLSPEEILTVAKNYAGPSAVRDGEFFSILHSIFLQKQAEVIFREISPEWKFTNFKDDLSLFTDGGPFERVWDKTQFVAKVSKINPKQPFSSDPFLTDYGCFLAARWFIEGANVPLPQLLFLKRFDSEKLNCFTPSISEYISQSNNSYSNDFSRLFGSSDVFESIIARVSTGYFGERTRLTQTGISVFGKNQLSLGPLQEIFFPFESILPEPRLSDSVFLEISTSMSNVSPQCKLFKVALDAGELPGYLGVSNEENSGGGNAGVKGGNAGVKPGNAGVKGEDTAIKPGNAGVKGELPVRPCYSIDQL